MKFINQYVFVLLLFLFEMVTPVFAQVKIKPGVIEDFSYSKFDEKSNKRTYDIFGKTAKFFGEDDIEVADMKMDLFDESTGKIRAVLKSSSAKINTKTKRVDSSDRLYVDSQEFNLSGKKWSWDGDKSVVDLYSDVTINFTPTSESSVKRTAQNKIILTPQKTVITGNTARLENSSKENKFYVKGNAKVRATNLQVDCSNLKAVAGDMQGKTSSGDISLIDAQGDVVMTRDNYMASAEHAEIFPREDRATLSGSPEIVDLSSKAKLLGEEIHFLRNSNSIKAVSSKQNRATAVFLHTTDTSKTQNIIISADDIVMSAKESQTYFLFVGNVVVTGEDFTAECSKIVAYARNTKENSPRVDTIECLGGVALKNKDGLARAWKIDIFPSEERVVLRGNVILTNSQDGTTLESEELTLLQKQNRGEASTTRNKFVVLSISEKATSDVLKKQTSSDKKSTKSKSKKSKNGKTIVKSRTLEFSRNGNKSTFLFNKDVTITSNLARAKCGKMYVHCLGQKNNSSKIERIKALESARNAMRDYSAMAEIIIVNPKNDEDNSDTKNRHKSVELLISEQKPNVRPKILLPPLTSVGLMEPEKQNRSRKSRMTVIESDKQWLSSGETEKYIFEGNIKMTATDSIASCDKGEVYISKPNRVGVRKIEKIVFNGNVKVSQQGLYRGEQMDKTVTSQKAEISPKDKSKTTDEFELAEFSGSPKLYVNGVLTEDNCEKIIFIEGVDRKIRAQVK